MAKKKFKNQKKGSMKKNRSKKVMAKSTNPKNLGRGKSLKTGKKTQSQNGKKRNKVTVSSKRGSRSAKNQAIQKTSTLPKKAVKTKGKSISPSQVEPRSKSISSRVTDGKAKSSLQIHPLQDYVLVKLIQRERMTPGGIIVPDTVEGGEAYYHGEVTAVGPGRVDKKGKRHTLDVKRGDRVLFQKWAGQRWQDQGVEYVILRENEILGIDEGRQL